MLWINYLAQTTPHQLTIAPVHWNTQIQRLPDTRELKELQYGREFSIEDSQPLSMRKERVNNQQVRQGLMLRSRSAPDQVRGIVDDVVIMYELVTKI